MPTNTADRIIARLPVSDRRAILNAIVQSTHGNPVLVEYDGGRSLEGATAILGRLLGVAYTPGGQTVDTLVVQPAARSRRMVAISAAHVLRISHATQLDHAEHPEAPVVDDALIPYRLGEVIAGPARKDA